MIVPFTVAALALVPPPLQRQNVLMRRGDFLVGALLTPLLPPRPAWADEASKSAGAAVTDKVKLEFVEQVSAQESRTLAMTIGLFGKEAPDAVAAFRDACAGKLAVPCPSEVDLTLEVMERSKQSKKAALKACLGYEAEPVTYAYSQVWSIQRGRRIDAGAVQGKFAMRVPPVTPSTEAAALPHDAAGLLSVRRGGGIFDFGLTTGPTPEYDAEYAVIGRVLEGMESLAELDALPVVVRADSAPRPHRTRQGLTAPVQLAPLMTRVRCVCRVCDRAEGGGGAQRGGCERIAGKGMRVRLTEQLLRAEQAAQEGHPPAHRGAMTQWADASSGRSGSVLPAHAI